MARHLWPVHPAHMAARIKRKPHYLREWREKLGLSLEEVAERVKVLSAEWANADPETRAMSMTHATLSRIERAKLPYNQHLLELLADIYQTQVASLIMRDPSDPDGLWSIYDALTLPERRQVVEIAKTIRRTGTEG